MRVREVRRVPVPVRCYDLTVSEYHTSALANGVVVSNCDQQCGGNSCGVCDVDDLRLRAARIKATDADIDLARVKVIDQDSVALKVRAKLQIPAGNRFVSREHWRYAIRRAAYRAQHDLDWKTGIAKKTIVFGSDAMKHRDWACGTDYAEFGLTFMPQRLELFEFIGNMRAELEPWLVVGDWNIFPVRSSVRRDASLALWELEPPDSADLVAVRLAAFAAAEYVKLVIRSDSAYFGAGTEEVNAKDWVTDLWLARDGHRHVLKMLTNAKAGPYSLYAAIMGKPSWIAAAAKPAVRVGMFAARSRGDLFRPPCPGCGEEIPVGLLDEAWGDWCPRCADQVAGTVTAGLPRLQDRVPRAYNEQDPGRTVSPRRSAGAPILARCAGGGSVSGSLRYPVQTGHQRPAERRFFIWRDRFIQYRDGHRPWRWCCTLCDPPSFGFRSLPGGWDKIMTVTLPRHMTVRHCHHRYVARTHG